MTRKLLLATTAVACLVLVGCNKETASTKDGSDVATTTTTTTSTDAMSPAASNEPTDMAATPSSTDMAATTTEPIPPVGAIGPESTTADTAAQTNTSTDAAAIAEAQLEPATTSQGFVHRVGMSDQFELQSSRLVLLRPVSPELKSYAQMMIDAHTATSAKVKDIATRDSLSLPAGLTAEQQSAIDKLRVAPDATFAAMYLSEQQKAHTAALKLLGDYAASGDNADLKQFATETRPKVQEHLTKAQALAKAEGSGNPS